VLYVAIYVTMLVFIIIRGKSICEACAHTVFGKMVREIVGGEKK